MKVLLIGDFTIVNNALKEGLEFHGIKTTIASIGDGTGEFPRDIDLRSKFEIRKNRFRFLNILINISNKILNTSHCLRILKKLYNYDIVQFISFNSFGNILFPYFFINKVIEKNKKSVMYSCGTDLAFIKGQISGKFKYISIDEPEKILNKLLKGKQKFNKYINKLDLIIPALYGYYVGMSEYKNCGEIITFPFLIRNHNNSPKTKHPIVICFYPRRSEPSKFKSKGSKYILEALEIIQNTHKGKVEIIINERVDYEKYVKNLCKTDILIDQCRSYSYAMAAITGMSKGKVVLSGAEKEAIESLKVDFCPVVNITPDVNQIVSVLSDLINNTEKINQLKHMSIEYVERYHDSKVIANQFINVYNNLLDSDEK